MPATSRPMRPWSRQPLVEASATARRCARAVPGRSRRRRAGRRRRPGPGHAADRARDEVEDRLRRPALHRLRERSAPPRPRCGPSPRRPARPGRPAPWCPPVHHHDPAPLPAGGLVRKRAQHLERAALAGPGPGRSGPGNRLRWPRARGAPTSNEATACARRPRRGGHGVMILPGWGGIIGIAPIERSRAAEDGGGGRGRSEGRRPPAHRGAVDDQHRHRRRGAHGDQVDALRAAGSELVRVTVNNEEAARAVPDIVERLDRLGVASRSSATSTTTATCC